MNLKNMALHELSSIDPLFEYNAELISALDIYADPSRYYHNLDHIEHGLRLMEERSSSTVSPALKLAWFFHDLYVESAKSNFKTFSDSIAFVTMHMAKLESIVSIGMNIAVTSHKVFKNPMVIAPSFALILSADLAILGSSPEEFQDYRNKVRLEYVLNMEVTETEFVLGSKAFAQEFLSRNKIFYHPGFYDLEEAARKNLKTLE